MPKRAHQRFLKNFFTHGTPVSEVRNRSVKKYLAKISRPGYHMIVWSTYILVISDNNIGVTILTIPKFKKELNN